MLFKFRGVSLVCVYVSDLHIFHTDPLVIGQNGPHRHCLNTLLLLREWKRRKKGSHIKTSSFSQDVQHALNNKYNVRYKTKTDKECKTLVALSSHLNAVRWGMFTLWSARGLYDMAHIPWRPGYMQVWERGHNCRQFPGLDHQPSARGRTARLAAPSNPNMAGWETERQWQAEVSVERCICEWRVSLIWLRANLIASHIIFIFLKLSGDCALGRRWHSLEMSSVSSECPQSDMHKQTEAHACTHIHTHKDTRATPPFASCRSPADTHLQIH